MSNGEVISVEDPTRLMASDESISLALRTDADLQELTALVLEPDEATARFLRGRAPTTEDECAQMFGSADALVQASDDGPVLVLWFPVRRISDRVLVGYVQVQSPDGHQPETIVHIGKSYRREGYATAALRLTIDLLFAETDAKWVEAVVDEKNPSRAIVRELGFQDEGPTNISDDIEEHTWLLPPSARTWP